MIRLVVDDSFSTQTAFSADQSLHLQERVNETCGQGVDGDIGISLVSDQEIRRLNRMYRGKDSVTDVLSFTYRDKPHAKGASVGDVVISLEQAKRQAEAGDVDRELVDLVVHGVLHVLGYDHETAEDAKRMFPLQDQLVNDLL